MPTERPPWLVPAIAAALVLVLLIVGGGYFLTHRGTSSNNTATTSPKANPKTSPKTSPKASPNVSPSPTTALVPVPTFAPLANDPITKVQFCLPEATCAGGTSPDTKCTLNSTCKIDIGIYWTGIHAIPKLSYVIEFFDRCANQSKVVFQKTDNTDNHVSWIPAPNGGFPVTLPAGVKAAAIVAVATTDKGVSAASAPYDLPGSATSCA